MPTHSKVFLKLLDDVFFFNSKVERQFQIDLYYTLYGELKHKEGKIESTASYFQLLHVILWIFFHINPLVF